MLADPDPPLACTRRPLLEVSIWLPLLLAIFALPPPALVCTVIRPLSLKD